WTAGLARTVEWFRDETDVPRTEPAGRAG
ncbi:MAG: hypothetical protein MOP51_2844, partial [Citricoccus sp.]|nr:hypothetical protein [Citricoccus sp. WCRC_4]